MLNYCAHEYGGDLENIARAGEIINKLQKADLENTYISPLHAFSFLKYNEISYEEEIALCLELLKRCDKLIVISKITTGIRIEITLAEALGIPIEFYYPLTCKFCDKKTDKPLYFADLKKYYCPECHCEVKL